MRRHFNALTAAFVALSSMALSACGPDDGPSATSASADQNNTTSAAAQSGRPTGTSLSAPAAPQLAAQSAAPSSTPPTVPALAFGASATPGATADAAPDTAVQSVEASLVADSQQVPPVMHFAPGDSDQNSSRN
ncbi:hypothetical protein [Paraburkholderia sp. DHOC27]|uniref:hypothetical protein n=1 Tax=Paraburkholderia sp. DHOC27 TaxID=2303330 RepID=UPI000E3D8110|nr:hypothetical protein [Paraburkholderia sp. DHOC27]RFU48519.1 hypothetical protein D0B32_01395 [Paraburkholderia sp. DHOC27]